MCHAVPRPVMLGPVPEFGSADPNCWLSAGAIGHVSGPPFTDCGSCDMKSTATLPGGIPFVGTRHDDVALVIDDLSQIAGALVGLRISVAGVRVGIGHRIAKWILWRAVRPTVVGISSVVVETIPVLAAASHQNGRQRKKEN